MDIIIHFTVSAVATFAFAKLFNAPVKELLYCGITGGIAWIIFFILSNNNLGVVLPMLISSFGLTIFARIIAAIRRVPVTVYLVCGIFPLVPGRGVYYTIYYLITRESGLAGEYGLRTLEVAIAITFGIIFGSSIPQKFFNRFNKEYRNKKELTK
ncbi:threonine/serine exporter family protein [Howardella ureilytica]|nr:threonine/serine exporter family protein [Lachnospiraceae bacterium]